MSPRRFSILTTVILVAGLIGVAIFNGLVDPYGQYDSKFLPPIVQDSRSEKLALFEKLETAPDGLILGSSRVLKIEPEYLQAKTGRTFFNAGVNHGRPTDYLAWIRCYEQRWNKLPGIVVLGVDTAAFSPVVPIDGRITGEPAMAKLVPERVTWKERAQLLTELLSFKQTKASTKALAFSLLRKSSPAPIEFFAPDGRIVYEKRERELREGTYDFASAFRYNQAEFNDVYKNFDRLVVDEIFTLVDTVDRLRSKGTAVYLFNTPFHPELRRSLSAIPYFDERESEAKQLLEILAERYDVRTVDLSEPRTFEGKTECFVDGIHPLEVNTRLMMDRLFEVPGKDRYAVQ